MKDDLLASSTERIFALVELFLARPEGISPQDILAEINMPRSSLYATLAALKDLGYVEQNELRGRYRAGPRMLAWRISGGDFRQDLLSAFERETTRRSWPDTLLLVVPAQDGYLVVGQTEGSALVRSVYKVGEVRVDMAASAGALSSHPTGDIAALGYALSSQAETLELALPVCPNGSDPQAALVLSIPAFRTTPQLALERWLADMRVMAAHLSYRLGALTYRPYQPNAQSRPEPAVAMTSTEIDAFLHGPWTARLACLRPDGNPHVIPVWQEWDGQGFTLIAWQGSAWADYVRQNPHISLTVDEPWPPMRRLVVRGQARALPYESDLSALRRLAARMAQRYLGENDAEKTAGRIQGAFQIQVESLRGVQGFPGNPGQESKTA